MKTPRCTKCKYFCRSKAKRRVYDHGDGYSESAPSMSADKVEPKFKVGDWIIYRDEGCAEILRISGITKTHYICIDISDDYCRNLNIKFIDSHNYHLWTIQDAKDGDVLVDRYGNIGIFEKTFGFDWHSYCYLGCNDDFMYNEIGGSHDLVDTYPATKEQRDLLFQKMKETGYEWDAKNLQLTKILHVKELSDGINIDKQKLAEWSEEDERNLNDAILFIETGTYSLDKDNLINWLKSLKQRIGG